MALTNELISQFAKATNDTTTSRTDSIVYGTIVKKDKAAYVQLDGSNILTPVRDSSYTTNIEAGERVTVLIKNHSAIVTGNITSPSARSTEVVESVSDLETKIEANSKEIVVAVSRTVGGTQLLKNTKLLRTGYTVSDWQIGSGQSRVDGDDGFGRLNWELIDKTAASWTSILSPISQLPDGWVGRTVILSAWLYSDNWDTLDNGMYWGISVSKGDRTRTWFTQPLIIKTNGDLGATVIGEKPVNGQWTRLAVPVTLTEENLTSVSGALADATHIFAAFYVIQNGVVSMKMPKLEFSDVVTDWSSHPEELVSGSTIRIDENQVDITTPVYSVNVLTEDGSRNALTINEEGVTANWITAPNVSPRYSGAMVLAVNPDASSDAIEAGDTFKSLSDIFGILNGRQIEGNLVINCTENAVIYGNIELYGVCGGSITINGNSATLNGSITLTQCSTKIKLDGLNVVASEGDAVSIDSGIFVGLSECTLRSETGNALVATEGVRVFVEHSTLTSTSGKAASVTNAAFAVFVDCVGTGALSAKYASLSAEGTVPSGGCENLGGSLMSVDGVTPTGPEGEAPEVQPPQTATYLMTNSENYCGGWSRFSDNDVRQGYAYDKPIYGIIWFDMSEIQNGLSGKTINQASLRLHMWSGIGRGVSVSVELHGGTLDRSALSGVYPTTTANYGTIGSTSPGVVNEITIPTQVITDMANGTINALILKSSDDSYHNNQSYSRNYARFSGETSGTDDTKPRLTVIYT